MAAAQLDLLGGALGELYRYEVAATLRVCWPRGKMSENTCDGFDNYSSGVAYWAVAPRRWCAQEYLHRCAHSLFLLRAQASAA